MSLSLRAPGSKFDLEPSRPCSASKKHASPQRAAANADGGDFRRNGYLAVACRAARLCACFMEKPVTVQAARRHLAAAWNIFDDIPWDKLNCADLRCDRAPYRAVLFRRTLRSRLCFQVTRDAARELRDVVVPESLGLRGKLARTGDS